PNQASPGGGPRALGPAAKEPGSSGGVMSNTIGTVQELEAIYGLPAETSLVKEVPRITPHYRAMIEASPFAVLATGGPEGLDCSPRGDVPGFVSVADDRTLMLPDR